MRTCPSCGRIISDMSAATCPHCGQSLDQGQPAQTVPVTSSAAPQASTDQAQPGAPAASQPNYAAGYGAGYGNGYGTPGAYPGAYYPGAYPGMQAPAGASSRRFPLAPVLGGVTAVLVVIAIVTSIYVQSNPQIRARISAEATRRAVASSNQLNDNLLHNSNSWAVGDNYYFRADGYHIKNSHICFAPFDNPDDGTESVTVKQVAGADNEPYGLVFRSASDGSQRYVFGIDSRGSWVVYLLKNGAITHLHPYTHDAVIKTGLNVENTLSVDIRGSTFDLWINGVHVGTVHDSTLTGGKWGLLVVGDIEAVFTDYLARA